MVSPNRLRPSPALRKRLSREPPSGAVPSSAVQLPHEPAAAASQHRPGSGERDFAQVKKPSSGPPGSTSHALAPTHPRAAPLPGSALVAAAAAARHRRSTVVCCCCSWRFAETPSRWGRPHPAQQQQQQQRSARSDHRSSVLEVEGGGSSSSRFAPGYTCCWRAREPLPGSSQQATGRPCSQQSNTPLGKRRPRTSIDTPASLHWFGARRLTIARLAYGA